MRQDLVDCGEVGPGQRDVDGAGVLLDALDAAGAGDACPVLGSPVASPPKRSRAPDCSRLWPAATTSHSRTSSVSGQRNCVTAERAARVSLRNTGWPVMAGATTYPDHEADCPMVGCPHAWPGWLPPGQPRTAPSVGVGADDGRGHAGPDVRRCQDTRRTGTTVPLFGFWASPPTRASSSAIVSPTPSQGGASPLGSSPPRRGSPTMHFTLRIDGTAAHITVHGEIDYTTLPTLRAATAGLPREVTEPVRDLHDARFTGRRRPPPASPYWISQSGGGGRISSPRRRSVSRRSSASIQPSSWARRRRRLLYHHASGEAEQLRPRRFIVHVFDSRISGEPGVQPSDCPVPLDLDLLPSGFDGREFVSSEFDHRRSEAVSEPGNL